MKAFQNWMWGRFDPFRHRPETLAWNVINSPHDRMMIFRQQSLRRHATPNSALHNTLSRLIAIVLVRALISFLALIVWSIRAGQANSDASRVVHEWRTLTELYNEKGRSPPGINTEDEPVPGFVHGPGRTDPHGLPESSGKVGQTLAGASSDF